MAVEAFYTNYSGSPKLDLPPEARAKLNTAFLEGCLNYESSDGGEQAVLSLKGGADANSVNAEGETALHLLVRGITCCDLCGLQSWRRELARALVELDGVDPQARDCRGHTAQDVAEAKSFEDFGAELGAITAQFVREASRELRFAKGSRIEASVDSGFLPGTVIRTWDGPNAYRIRLDSGVEVWAPKDRDSFVRKIVLRPESSTSRASSTHDRPRPPAPPDNNAGRRLKSHHNNNSGGLVGGGGGGGVGGSGRSDGDGGAQRPGLATRVEVQAMYRSARQRGAEDAVDAAVAVFDAAEGAEENAHAEGGEGDAEADALIEALSASWLAPSTGGKGARLQLDPDIYRGVATMASSTMSERSKGRGGDGDAGAAAVAAERGSQASASPSATAKPKKSGSAKKKRNKKKG